MSANGAIADRPLAASTQWITSGWDWMESRQAAIGKTKVGSRHLLCQIGNPTAAQEMSPK